MITENDLNRISKMNEDYAIYAGEIQLRGNNEIFYPEEDVGECIDMMLSTIYKLRDENDTLRGRVLRLEEEIEKLSR